MKFFKISAVDAKFSVSMFVDFFGLPGLLPEEDSMFVVSVGHATKKPPRENFVYIYILPGKSLEFFR